MKNEDMKSKINRLEYENEKALGDNSFYIFENLRLERLIKSSNKREFFFIAVIIYLLLIIFF